VLDYTKTSCVERELLLTKVSILGPEFAQEQISGPTHQPSFDQAVEDTTPPPFVSTEGEQTPIQNADKHAREQALARSFENSASGGFGLDLYPSHKQNMSASEALIAKNLHLAGIKTITDQFGGKVVDVAENSCIVELTAKSSRLDNFLRLMAPFGVLEAARSGVMVLPRTPIPRYGEEEEAIAEREEIDVSMLPPG
jgi:acetolactate synthase-1/3 small subunit